MGFNGWYCTLSRKRTWSDHPTMAGPTVRLGVSWQLVYSFSHNTISSTLPSLKLGKPIINWKMSSQFNMSIYLLLYQTIYRFCQLLIQSSFFGVIHNSIPLWSVFVELGPFPFTNFAPWLVRLRFAQELVRPLEQAGAGLNLRTQKRRNREQEDSTRRWIWNLDKKWNLSIYLIYT